jgi:hypothetical protein
MDYDQWEKYYDRIPTAEFITISELSDITGCDINTIDGLIFDGFFGDLYEDGYFDYHAVEVLNDYLEE